MGGSTKQTTTRTPYDVGAVASANSTLANANTQAQGTIAQYSPALNNALNGIQKNIASPPAYLTDARNQLDKTINGDYLSPDSNPYTSSIADLIAKKTQGSYNTTFGASGRSHGGLAAQLSTQGVGDALQSFYGNQYNNERSNQMQAVGAAPSFHADENTDANALFAGVHNLAMMPLDAANAYGSGVTTVNSPYTTDTTTTKQSMGLGQVLGMAAQVAGAAMTGGASLLPSALSAGAGALGSLTSPGSSVLTPAGLLQASGGSSGSGSSFMPMNAGLGGLISGGSNFNGLNARYQQNLKFSA